MARAATNTLKLGELKVDKGSSLTHIYFQDSAGRTYTLSIDTRFRDSPDIRLKQWDDVVDRVRFAEMSAYKMTLHVAGKALQELAELDLAELAPLDGKDLIGKKARTLVPVLAVFEDTPVGIVPLPRGSTVTILDYGQVEGKPPYLCKGIHNSRVRVYRSEFVLVEDKTE